MDGVVPSSRSPSPPPSSPHPSFLQPPPSPISYKVLFSEPSDKLPEPLPTPEEIEESPLVIRRLDPRVTARVGGYVVKYGYDVEPSEGEAMRFVRRSTDIVIPRVYGIYNRPVENIGYIIMEFIPGQTLEELWDGLKDVERSSITSQLQKSFSSLRQIPHLGYFGSLGRTELADALFWTEEPVPEINGPFTTDDEVIQAIIGKYLYDSGESAKHKAQYYRRVLPNALRVRSDPVFTHNDFQRKNIIITPNGQVVLIDWAEAGWYPSYWEYATAIFACGRWEDDWHTTIGEVLEEFPNHYVWLNQIRSLVWG